MKTLATLLVLALCAPLAMAQQESAPRNQVLSAPGGRYVFGQISQARRDQYMLDTQTGRLWQIVQGTYKREDGTEGTYEFLDTVPYSQKPAFSLPPPAGKP